MKISYKPLIVAVFLVMAGLGFRARSLPGTGTVEVRAGINGAAPSLPAVARSQILVGIAEGAQIADSAALVQNGAPAVVGGVNAGSANSDVSDGGSAYDTAAIQDPGQPVGAVIDASGAGVIQYVVKKGDTLSGIAAHFGIPASGITKANPQLKKTKLRVGMILTISTGVPSTSVSLPNFNSYFVMPTQGYNEGILGSDNSIEIENSCGTPVTAAADGVVVPDNNIVNAAGGWNDGYGTFVLIEHPFGNEIFTRYAHLQQITVGIGDYVKQGQQIGLMGQSGNASACSLLFEVIGAKNPFAR